MRIVKIRNNDSISSIICDLGDLSIIKQIQLTDSTWIAVQNFQSWPGCILHHSIIHPNDIALANLINYDGDTICRTRYKFEKNNVKFYSDIFNEKIYKSQIQYFIEFKKIFSE